MERTHHKKKLYNLLYNVLEKQFKVIRFTTTNNELLFLDHSSFNVPQHLCGHSLQQNLSGLTGTDEDFTIIIKDWLAQKGIAVTDDFFRPDPGIHRRVNTRRKQRKGYMISDESKAAEAIKFYGKK